MASISTDITKVMNTYNEQNSSTAKTKSLERNISHLGKDSTDEELMQACKSFESYLVNQVMTKVKDALIPEKEDENEYLKMFGDKLYESYADTIADSGQLGLAQQLYEAMKREYKTASMENNE